METFIFLSSCCAWKQQRKELEIIVNQMQIQTQKKYSQNTTQITKNCAVKQSRS